MTVSESNIIPVRHQMIDHVWNQVHSKILNLVQYPIKSQIWYEMDNHIYQQLRFKLVNQVWDGFRHLIKK